MNKKIIKNYLYNISYQVIVMLIPFITTPYLSRVLGPENIGIYSYSLSITTYFVLFGSLGTALYGQREIAFVQNNKEKRTIAFYELFFMRCISLAISMILFFIFFCLNGQYALYFKILVLEILASIFDISWFFQGMEEFKKTVIRNLFIKLFSLICIFVFIKDSNDLIFYFIIYVISNVLGNITLWFYLPKLIFKPNVKKLNIKKHIKPVFMLFLPQIATQLYTVLDKVMIGVIISDKSEVGYYEQAQKIVKLLLTLITSLSSVMLSRIASLHASGEKNKIINYIYTSFRYALLIGFPVMFGLISITTKFVPLFYGKGYEKVIPLMMISSPIIVIVGLSSIIGTQYLLPTKKQKFLTISVLVGAIVNFSLNMIFINEFKSIGAAVATIISESCVLLTQLILVKNEISILEIIRISIKYFIASVLMFIVSIIVGSYFSNYVFSILAQITVSGIIYFILLFLFKDKFIIDFFNKIKLKLNK